MNAIKFIKEHGVEKAREVVEGAPDWATGINLNSLKYFGGDCFCGGDLLVSGLKRLVESVDLVGEYGGLYGAMDFISGYTEEQLAKPVYSPMLKIKQAIADYELIYCVADMGDDSHIENHVSPLCKVGVK